MNQNSSPATEGAKPESVEKSKRDWLPKAAWGVAGLMIILMVLTVLQVFGSHSLSSRDTRTGFNRSFNLQPANAGISTDYGR